MTGEPALDLGIELEKRFHTLPQLFLNVVFRAFDDMHGHAGLVAILKLYRALADFNNFVGRQKTHAVNQGKLCHLKILTVSQTMSSC